MKTFRLTQLVFLILLTSFVKAQDRENKSLPAVSPKILWSLTKATGWIKGSDGQWLKGSNKIQRLRLSSADVARFETGVNITGHDNFKIIEAREINVEGTSLLLITKKFIPGKWEYPTTQNGFLATPVISYVVIKKNNAELKTGEFSEPGFDIPLYYWGTVEDSPKYLSEIAVDINKQCVKYDWISSSKGTDRSLSFSYNELPDKTNCRFMLTSSQDGFSESEFLLNPAGRGFDFNYKNLKDIYFEVPVSSMAVLVSLLKPANDK
jgi:hypothetical protein